MRSLVVATAAALSALAPMCAAAQPVSSPSGPDTYLAFHAGAFVPQHDDLRGFDPGIAFGGTFGALFTRHVGVEAEVAYYRALVSDPGGARLSVVPLTASLRLRLPLKVAELSAIAGGGVHFARVSALDPGTGAPHFSESATAFGFHVGAAAAFNLSPTMLVGAEVRRTVVPASFAGADVGLDGLRVALTLSYNL
jgi:opacity protein-like surface antigen